MLFSKQSSDSTETGGNSGLASAMSQYSAHNKDEKRANSLFLNNYVFRKTYVTIQKTIDDWLRKVNQLEISVSELKRIKS